MTTLHFHHSGHRQSGVATLIIILILLFAITGITLYAAQSGIMEQKVAANDYRSKQIQEAADAGLDYALSWLTTYQPIWTTKDAATEHDITSITTSVGNFTVGIALERPVADPKKVTIFATATEIGNTSATKPTAKAQTTIVQKKSIAGDPLSPLMVNGCVSGVTGTPQVHNNTGGDEIVTSQDNSSGTCVNSGHLSDPGPPATTPAIDDDAFDGSAWDNLFGMSQAEMEALAALDPDVYWITDTTPWAPPSNPLGSISSPVIVIMTGCAKFNGTSTVYGIVYYSTPCSAPGWGNVDIYGSVIFEGDITSLTANGTVTYDPSYLAGFDKKNRGVQNRAPGSWIDRGN